MNQIKQPDFGPIPENGAVVHLLQDACRNTIGQLIYHFMVAAWGSDEIYAKLNRLLSSGIELWVHKTGDQDLNKGQNILVQWNDQTSHWELVADWHDPTQE